MGPLRANAFSVVLNFLRCGELASGFIRLWGLWEGVINIPPPVFPPQPLFSRSSSRSLAPHAHHPRKAIPSNHWASLDS